MTGRRTGSRIRDVLAKMGHVATLREISIVQEIVGEEGWVVWWPITLIGIMKGIHSHRIRHRLPFRFSVGQPSNPGSPRKCVLDLHMWLDAVLISRISTGACFGLWYSRFTLLRCRYFCTWIACSAVDMAGFFWLGVSRSVCQLSSQRSSTTFCCSF